MAKYADVTENAVEMVRWRVDGSENESVNERME